MSDEQAALASLRDLDPNWREQHGINQSLQQGLSLPECESNARTSERRLIDEPQIRHPAPDG